MSALLAANGKEDEANQYFQFTEMQFEYDQRKGANTPDNKKAVESQVAIPLSFQDPLAYHDIPDLNQTEILALGESIHGSTSLSRSGMQIMKHRILYANCNLLLFELPFDALLGINKYIKGDIRYGLETMNTLNFALYPKELTDFFVWLKEYNDTKQDADKVWVLGSDIPSKGFFSFESNLFAYFYPIFKNDLRDQEIKSFLRGLLTNSVKALNDMLPDLIVQKQRYRADLDKKEIALLQRWFSIFTNNSMQLDRDRFMYESICFFLEQICLSNDNVTIYSHIAHACSDNTGSLYSFTRSFGTLLNERYTSDYSSIGLITNSGRKFDTLSGWIRRAAAEITSP